MAMKFQPGVSANPDGRPIGTGHRQQLFKSLVEPYQEALFDTAIKLALEGSEAMLRLLLDRLLPAKPADNPVTLSIPKGSSKKAGMILASGAVVLEAVSQGGITPGQGKSLMAIIEAQRKNIEIADLAERLTEIERTLKPRKMGK
jgi:hypothetical protein